MKSMAQLQNEMPNYKMKCSYYKEEQCIIINQVTHKSLLNLYKSCYSKPIKAALKVRPKYT